MSELLDAMTEVRNELALAQDEVLFETCRVIIDGEEVLGDDDEPLAIPCRLSGGHNNIDGAPYRIRFAWDSPAVIGASVVVDAIPGRSALTLQLVAPVDSSTGVWQEWQATAGPAFGRVDVGL